MESQVLARLELRSHIWGSCLHRGSLGQPHAHLLQWSRDLPLLSNRPGRTGATRTSRTWMITAAREMAGRAAIATVAVAAHLGTLDTMQGRTAVAVVVEI